MNFFRNTTYLALREINSVFLSPLAYGVAAVFLLFSGYFFYLIAGSSRIASLSGPVGVISFAFFFVAPLLTMRLLSEEYRSGTIESLMTAPVTDAQVVIGKYIGALAFLLFMLAPTVVYVFILEWLGSPDYGMVISAYAGLLLSGAMFFALGLLCSALTRHQILAGVMGVVALLMLWIIGAVGERMTGILGSIVAYAGIQAHAAAMYEGRIAFRDIFYFVSLTVFWLFLTVQALESRRWR